MREADPRDAAATPGGDCWLAVGDGAARALEAHWRSVSGASTAPILRARDVYDALGAMRRQPVTGCVVSSRVLDPRPRAALRSLRRRLGLAPLMVFDRGDNEDACRIARDLGVVVWGAADEPAPPASDATRGPLLAPPPPAARPEPPPEPSAPQEAPVPQEAAARPASPLPRADEDAPPAAAVDPGRFATGCLERIGSVGSLVRYVLRTLSEVSNAGRISLLVRESSRETLCLRAGRGIREDLIGTVRCSIGTGVAGRVAALGRPVTGHGSTGGARGYRSSAFVVLPLGRGRACEGVVCLTALPGNRIPPEEVVRAWTRLGRQAGLALRGARRLQRAQALSTSDPLTRLPNRRAFESALHRELERARRSGTRLVVGLVDVDHFKAFNDRHGHAVGDRVLLEVARRLQGAFRETDLVARWGGEEFAVLLTGLEREDGPPRDPLRAMDRARLAVGGRPFTLGAGIAPAAVTVSGGFALFPDHAERDEMLLRQADEALYRAKDGGRNRIASA